MNISGFRIITSLAMCEDGEPYEVKRTWKERLFSSPWQPFRKTRWITPQIPRKDVLRLANGDLVMHPSVADELWRMEGK